MSRPLETVTLDRTGQPHQTVGSSRGEYRLPSGPSRITFLGWLLNEQDPKLTYIFSLSSALNEGSARKRVLPFIFSLSDGK
jgi:hypothetical protein